MALLYTMIRARESLAGAWMFLIGVVVATVGGIILSFGYGVNPIILSILAILGFIAGFTVDVKDNGGSRFLMSAVALVIVSFAGQQGIAEVQIVGINIGKIISSTLAGLLVLLVPATIVVAIKNLFSLSQR